MKIISYCLWGDNDLYYKGALKNIQLAKMLLPEFGCRFYVSSDFDKNKIKQLSKTSQVIVTNLTGSPEMMLYRFLPLSEGATMLSRDTDSRIGLREQLVVNEWLNSDKKLHIIKDHPYHNVAMLGGMWGAKNTTLNVHDLIEQFKKTKEFKNAKNCDQIFLWKYIYPYFLEEDMMIHDDFFGGIPININRYDDPYTFFIGQPIGIDNNENDYELYSNDRLDIEKYIKEKMCK